MARKNKPRPQAAPAVPPAQAGATTHGSGSGTSSREQGRGLPWLDVLAMALIVIRWFTPTEGTFRGDTLWIAQLWTVWGALASWTALRVNDQWRARFSKLDLGLLLLVGGHLVSALLVWFTTGQKRAALNGLSEWISLGMAAVWFARRASDAGFHRAFRIAVISAALGLSALGMWQRWVWQPQMSQAIQEYDRLEKSLPDLSGLEQSLAESRLRALRDIVGLEYATLDETGRRAMRQRVVDSSEPIGRFALANSFAALLVVAVILTAGTLVWSRSVQVASIVLLALAGGTALLAFVLLLTKSRTAFVGGLAAAGLATTLTVSGRHGLKPVLATGALIAVLIAGAWATGGLDRQVISEATKSFAYRMEYWQGAWNVVNENPIWGVGPGNFRQAYLQHKLERSSEEVLDPHNLVLDAWCAGGLLAVLGLGALTVMTLGSGLRIIRSRTPLASTASLFPSGFAGASLLLAGLLAWGEQWTLEGSDDLTVPVVAGLSTVIAFGLGRVLPRSEQSAGWTSSRLPELLAWIALTIHLLGAGGMEMPAIIQMWLCLLTLVVIRPASPDTGEELASVPWPVVVLITSLLLMAAQFQLATVPWVTVRTQINLAEAGMMNGSSPRQVDELLDRAMSADPYDPEPARHRARNAFGAWNATRDEEWLTQAVAAQHEAINRDPKNSHDQRSLAEIYLRHFAASKDPADALQAVAAMEASVSLYPNHVTGRRMLAEAYQAANDPRMVEASRSALELNELYVMLGHLDKALTDSQKAELQAIAGH